MIFYAPSASSQSSKQLQPPEQQDYTLPAYATPTIPIVGGVRRDSQLANPTHQSLASSTAPPTILHQSLQLANMPQKRSASIELNGNAAKQIKTERPEDFSDAVKQKLETSTRTGQACDRCKVRKIRCDATATGCSPCLQNNTECLTTDRITKVAVSRRHVNDLQQEHTQLEQQVKHMQYTIQALQEQLRQNGITPKASAGYLDQGASNAPSYNYNPAPAVAWNASNSSYSSQPGNNYSSPQQETNMFRALPPFRSGCTGDNYLGVSPGNSNLSSIKGTALSILGMEIDIADFNSVDMDEPTTFQQALYNKSYQAFLQSALNINPSIPKVDLPERNLGLTYAAWYFRVINPYLPLLHKPTFFKILQRVYDDETYHPTTAETVIIHMVFAIMYFQYSVRNSDDPNERAHLNHQSNMHYHYSLSQFYQLSCSHTFQDVQALTLICAHLRNFPKPGASWMFSQTTMALAIELGLHRSSKRWAPDTTPNPLETEMRKRTFWSLLAIHVTLSGKLGRPMAFGLDDFDVELPEPLDDELLSETGLDTSRPGKCLHHVGLAAFKLLPLFMEMYSTVYAVRRNPETYISTVNNLEAKLRAWQDSLPRELVSPDDGDEAQVFPLFAQVWALEFRLLLRHPSLSENTDPTLIKENTRICAESARQMLKAVKQLQKYKCLDTTWYNAAVYVMAITMTLFAQWDKRGEATVADLVALRTEMDHWLDVMGDVGVLLGSGNRLAESIRVIADSTIGLLSRSLPSSKPTYTKALDTKPRRQSISHANHTSFNASSQNYNYNNESATNGDPAPSNYIPVDSLDHQQTPYPAATQYPNYTDPATNASIAYTPNENYSAYPATSDAVDAPLLAAFATQASQVAPNSWRAPSVSLPANTASNAWHQWTMEATNPGSEDFHISNALMQLGGREMRGDHTALHSSSSLTDLNVPAGMDQGHIDGPLNGGIGAQWPMNIFNIGSGN